MSLDICKKCGKLTNLPRTTLFGPCRCFLEEEVPFDLVYDLVRSDGRLERVCKHGVGHPVGHKDPSKIDRYTWIHGCDGCCANYKRMEKFIMHPDKYLARGPIGK